MFGCTLRFEVGTRGIKILFRFAELFHVRNRQAYVRIFIRIGHHVEHLTVHVRKVVRLFCKGFVAPLPTLLSKGKSPET